MSQSKTFSAGLRLPKLGLSGLLILGLALTSFYSARIAMSKIYLQYGVTIVDPTPLGKAIALTPNDAEAHYVRGELANYLERSGEALSDLEVAASLRPRDYVLWLELGMTRDQLGERAGALVCFNEAIRLAPYYAQPLWQRGNLLFRQGMYDDAFADLRQAATSNPEFLPALIDLAWESSRKDAAMTEQIVQVSGDREHFVLALFFARQGKATEAVAQYREAGSVSAEHRRDVVKALLSGHAIAQAYEVWGGKRAAGGESFYDGGFESALNREEAEFGWRVVAGQPGVNLSVDGNQPQSGLRSLRIDFNGHTAPAVELVSQLIPVEPSVRYRVNFAARTKDIVTGGPLLVIVKDASNQQLLDRSAPLPASTDGWQNSSIEFTTGALCSAIVIALRREECSSSPCPIFGSLNLDSFSLEKIKQPGVR